MAISLTVTQLIEELPRLKAGDRIALTGEIYTARDAAHQRLTEMIQNKKPLPLRLKDAVIYYCGPAPARPGDATGPCGPTTSSRMDGFTPLLLSLGVKATIGKGPRSARVKEALKEFGAVYLVATGGVAALLSRKVRSVELVAFGDLGPEAIYRFQVLDFPLIVAADMYGNDIFEPASK